MSADTTNDPYLWLEEVLSERALAWVRERNALTRKTLDGEAGFDELRGQIERQLDSKDELPYITRRGAWFYNFWRDAASPRGVMRRTTLEEYRKPQPAWEVVLDIDALARSENENWVWAGVEWLTTDHSRLLLSLSRGGGDAKVVREFDLHRKSFVADGFQLVEAKTHIAWIDRDTVFVGTDFGPGSMTASGYPRIAKRWRRGTPLGEAEVVFEGAAQDLGVTGRRDNTPHYERDFVQRQLDFFNSELFLLEAKGPRKVDKPTDADAEFWRDWLVLTLKSEWTVGGRVWPSGSALICKASDYLSGERAMQTLFAPTETSSLGGIAFTASTIILTIEDKVASRLEEWTEVNGQWSKRDLEAPSPGKLVIMALHDPHANNDPMAEAYFQNYAGFLEPDTLSLRRTTDARIERLRSRPSFFDSRGMRVEQRFATSKDGVRIPYFVVWPKGAQSNGANPTLLHAYGGLNLSMTPSYLGPRGVGWVGRGGVFVLANIRGGGEFGPSWHQAALRGKRQTAFNDLTAVAEDLIATGVTSPKHLGIEGGSNGGLLVSAVMVQRPELFNAVLCQVPLTDMKRYHLLLAGASWVAEFGDPDNPEEWAFLSRYSPYQNVQLGVRYPAILFITSTRDDRVHPAHARKMAARMIEQGHEVMYYENVEGGHGGSSNNKQRADILALEFAFLWRQLGGQSS